MLIAPHQEQPSLYIIGQKGPELTPEDIAFLHIEY